MNIISNTLINTTMRPNSTDDEHIWLEEFNRTWKFEGEYAKNNPTLWDPKGAQVEYEVDDTDSGKGPDASTDAWDAQYPENTTRYLRPDKQKYLKISSEVKDVFVDPIPPTFISDEGTEYIALETNINGYPETGIIVQEGDKKVQYSNNVRTISFKFSDEVGLDCKQIGIYIGDDLPADWYDEEDENIIYYYDRTMPEDNPNKKNYFAGLSIYSSSNNLFNIKFNLHEKYGTVVEGIGEVTIEDEVSLIDDILKDKNLNIIIWDLAGNSSIFTFPKNKFKVLTTDDLNNIVPVNIVFTKIEPDNFYLEDGIDCNIITNVIDPNKFLWEYENVAQLLDTSVGAIDLNTYNADDNRDHNPLDGIREFVITNITSSGIVEVEAWVATGFDEDLDKVLKEKTYNTATCGPWIYGEEGRKYHICPYIPKYLHGTEFADFIEYFQLYINTMYKSLDTNRHISGLEKIARIGNFNDISRLESALLQNYSDEFGSEFNFNMDSLQKMSDLFNVNGYNINDAKETIDLIKYVFEQLPAYNCYKGTNTGIEMAIKMFGFVCKTINLWIQKENQIKEYPEFLEEESLDSFKDYFQTSRFNLDINPTNMNYTNFITNVDAFIDLIKSIKPINQILNCIEYIIKTNKTINFVYKLNEYTDDNVQYKNELEFEYTWTFTNNSSSVYNNLYLLRDMTRFNPNTNQTDFILLDYNCSGDNISRIVNTLGTFFKSSYNELIIKTIKRDSGTGEIIENGIDTYTIKREDILVKPLPGIIQIQFKNNIQKCTDIVKSILNVFDENSNYKEILLKIKFKILPGTRYGISLEP